MFDNLKLFWPPLKEHRRRYIAGAVALFFTDIIDVSLPLLTGLAVDRMMDGVHGRITTAQAISGLVIIGLIYLAGVLVQGGLRYWWRYAFHSTSLMVGNSLRNRLFGHLQKLSMNFFHNARTGDIMSRATNDVEWVRMFLGDGVTIILDITFYLMMVPFIMVSKSPTLMLITILSCIFLPFFVRSVGNRLHKKSAAVQESMSGISQSAEENFSGIRVVKSFAQEKNQSERFREANDIYLKKNLSLAKTSSFFHPFLGFNVGVSAFLLLLVGGLQVIDGKEFLTHKEFSVGDLVAFMQLLGRIAWPMVGLGMSVTIYQRASASMSRLMQIFNIRQEVPDNGTKKTPVDSHLQVEFKDIDFDHRMPELSPDGIPQQDKVKTIPVLKNINLTIPANSTVAITGPIGSGKTTLLNLLCRFYDPTAGAVLINGVDIREYSVKDLRSLIGFVPQDIFLFSDMIKDNMTFGLNTPPPNEADRLSKIAEAVDMRQAIESLPDKYEAYLGERGINLSGGQRQRMSLARALMKNPPLLILDDCFSAVDYETERKILRNIIEHKSKSQTVIVVSHRLAVMSMADSIVFMDNGIITEQGSHQELLAKGGSYAKFSEYQSVKEKLEEI